MLVCSAATSCNIDQSGFCHFTQMRGSKVGKFLIFTHLVGQSGIRIDGNRQGNVGGKLFHEGSQICDAEGTVQAETEQIGIVADARIECPKRLSRQSSATSVVYGDRHHDRNFPMKPRIYVIYGCESGFRVEGIVASFQE